MFRFSHSLTNLKIIQISSLQTTYYPKTKKPSPTRSHKASHSHTSTPDGPHQLNDPRPYPSYHIPQTYHGRSGTLPPLPDSPQLEGMILWRETS